MDPTLIAEQPTGFIAWIMANGQIVAFFAQVFYWVVLPLLIGYAVWQYKRWVNFQLGTGRSGKLRTETADAPEPSAKVSVEEFVE